MSKRNTLAATKAGAPLLAAALCACSADAPEPGPMPTTYEIAKADLTAAKPNDICRTRNSAFLRNVLLRITEVLPQGSSSFEFTEFRVDEPKSNGDRTATVRFRIAVPGEPAQTMRAVASFDPENCTTGEWSVEREEGAGKAGSR